MEQTLLGGNMSHLICLKIVLNKPAFSNQKIVLKVLVFKIR